MPLAPAPSWTLTDPAPETIGIVVRCRWDGPADHDDGLRWVNEGGMWAHHAARTAEFLGLFEWQEIVSAARAAGATGLIATAFCCPRCRRSSSSTDDMADGYCGSCHARTGHPAPRWL